MDGLTRTVREQLALGRLLPLGDAGEALWIAESAVVARLRRTAAGVPGVRLGAVEVRLAAADHHAGAAVAPPGALPHGPLRLTAGFEAAVDEPLPRLAERLRAALGAAVRDGLGAKVEAVDLRVTGLLGSAGAEGRGGAADEKPGPAGVGPAIVEGTAGAVEAAVRAVPGVAGLTRRLSGFGPGVRVLDTPAAREVHIQLAVTPERPAVTVARAAAAAARSAAQRGTAARVTTALVVTP